MSRLSRNLYTRVNDAEAAVKRARAVVDHWREKAAEADAHDADATAKLPAAENLPVVTYVPAAVALRLAANRLEDALDGW